MFTPITKVHKGAYAMMSQRGICHDVIRGGAKRAVGVSHPLGLLRAPLEASGRTRATGSTDGRGQRPREIIFISKYHNPTSGICDGAMSFESNTNSDGDISGFDVTLCGTVYEFRRGHVDCKVTLCTWYSIKVCEINSSCT